MAFDLLGDLFWLKAIFFLGWGGGVYGLRVKVFINVSMIKID